MHSPTLFLLFFTVTLLNVLGGLASLAKEVSVFTLHFYFITIYLAPFAPKHLPNQDLTFLFLPSFLGTSSFKAQSYRSGLSAKLTFPGCLFSHFSAYFPQTPILTTFLCIPLASTCSAS